MIIQYTSKEFVNKGIELFGRQQEYWSFCCPVCGLDQTADDFIRLKAFDTITEAFLVTGFTCIGFWKNNCTQKTFIKAIGEKDAHKGCCYSCDMIFPMYGIEVTRYDTKGKKQIRKFFDFSSK